MYIEFMNIIFLNMPQKPRPRLASHNHTQTAPPHHNKYPATCMADFPLTYPPSLTDYSPMQSVYGRHGCDGVHKISVYNMAGAPLESTVGIHVTL